MSTREASWLPAPGPEFLMDSGEHLYCLLMEVLSPQLVLQGSTEAEGFALGNRSRCWLHCCSLPSLPYFLILYSCDSIFGLWKSWEARLLHSPRKKDHSGVILWHTFCLFNFISINAFKNKWSVSLLNFVLLRLLVRGKILIERFEM